MFGVTSWGEGCAFAGKPGVYADVRSKFTSAHTQNNGEISGVLQVFNHGSNHRLEVNAKSAAKMIRRCESLRQNTYILSGVDFWARKFVKNVALLLRRRTSSPPPSQRLATTHLPTNLHSSVNWNWHQLFLNIEPDFTLFKSPVARALACVRGSKLTYLALANPSSVIPASDPIHFFVMLKTADDGRRNSINRVWAAPNK